MSERLALERELAELRREFQVPPMLLTKPDFVIDRFVFDKAELTAAHRAVLDAVAERILFSKRFGAPPERVLLVGHTDERGTDLYNDDLGSRRAEAAEQGIVELLRKDPSARGHVTFTRATRGEREPVDTGKTEAARVRNRRVEIFFLARGQVPPPPPPPKPPEPVEIVIPKPPTPTSTSAQRRGQVMPAFTWKSPEWRRTWSYFEVFFNVELEATISANATDADFAIFKGKWIKDSKDSKGGFGEEVEFKFKEWFKPDVKIEADKGGLKVSFKKDFKVFGVQVSPHVSPSADVLSLEFDEFLRKDVEVELFGQTVRITAQPKVVVTLRIVWLEVLKRKLKRKLKDWLVDLLGILGRRLLGSAALPFLAKLLGPVLGALLLDDPPNTTLDAGPDDIAGMPEALKPLAAQAGAEARFQTWANRFRSAFAVAYADSLRELFTKNWRARVGQLAMVSELGYSSLPAPTAPAAAWERWASTNKAMKLISLPTAAKAHSHFRWYEIALMFAVAAYLLRRITPSEFDGVVKVCMDQANLAGMSLALSAMRTRIALETKTYEDDRGKVLRINGEDRWNALAAVVRGSGLTPDQMNERLSALALRQLPPKLWGA